MSIEPKMKLYRCRLFYGTNKNCTFQMKTNANFHLLLLKQKIHAIIWGRKRQTSIIYVLCFSTQYPLLLIVYFSQLIYVKQFILRHFHFRFFISGFIFIMGFIFNTIGSIFIILRLILQTGIFLTLSCNLHEGHKFYDSCCMKKKYTSGFYILAKKALIIELHFLSLFAIMMMI